MSINSDVISPLTHCFPLFLFPFHLYPFLHFTSFSFSRLFFCSSIRSSPPQCIWQQSKRWGKKSGGSSDCCKGPESWQLWERTADPSYIEAESRDEGRRRGREGERGVCEMEWSNISVIKGPFNLTVSGPVSASISCVYSCLSLVTRLWLRGEILLLALLCVSTVTLFTSHLFL